MLQVQGLNNKRWLNLLLRFMSSNYRGVSLAKGSKVFADVAIGLGTRINGPAIFKGYGKAVIGKYCAIGDGLRVITSNHNMQRLSVQNALQDMIVIPHVVDQNQDVEIGHDVWIGDNVIVLPGVTIGNGAIIGAGAIVTRDVPSYHVAAGNPARCIKERFSSNVVECLEELQWWDWSVEKMKARRDLFELDFSTLQKLNAEAIKAIFSQHYE
ncbi:MAG: CatB-related O-acetyltransferase [Mariprofundus sp.]|nr:CatB-related O-acetyltransferase [Mariprofundus sp.]